MSADIRISRTGRLYSFGGTEYSAVYPDGSVEFIWSPPWGEDDDETKDRKASEYIHQAWSQRETTPLSPWSREMAREEFVKFFGEGRQLDAFISHLFPERGDT